jgi:amino acid adenylation domain-containing protein
MASGDSRTVLEMFELIAQEQPRETAIDSESGTLTWDEVMIGSAEMARDAAAAGVVEGEVVALAAGREPDFLVGVLAAWRLGCSFTVVDTSWPVYRLKKLMKTCGSRVLCDGRAVIMPPFAEKAGPARCLSYGPEAAYLLFTSGSSGEPKGAVVGHDGLANTIRHIADVLSSARSRPLGLCLAPLFYDAALGEIFGALAAGGRVYMASPTQRVDPNFVAQKIGDDEANWIAGTPSWLNLLSGAPQDVLRKVLIMSAGEPLPAGLARALIMNGAELWNVYGPTEAAICATMHRVRLSDTHPIPVGLPLRGMAISIVDSQLQQMPVGELGEIVISGPGVGLGYIGEEHHEGAAFINLAAGARAYRTGDLGSLDADGVLTCHGRLDSQVKIRGNRIELGDIEANARACVGVTDALALVGEVAGRRRLALLVAGTATDRAVREFLESRLPEHMHPAIIKSVTAMPLTDRGKLDRARAAAIIRKPFL